MNFNVGDTVKVRSDLIVNRAYGFQGFTKSMSKYLGQRAKITSKASFGYRIDIDDGSWWWTDEMFDCFHYSIEKVKNTIYIKKDNKVISKATCMVGDDFDEDFGVALAMAKALEVLPKSHVVKKIETIDEILSRKEKSE